MSAKVSKGLAASIHRNAQSRFIRRDKAGMTLSYIQSAAVMYKRKFDIKFLPIDYLQLINVPGISEQRFKIT